jgi:hypothetical protein
VLGAWDFDAERGLISYLSPLGQALLNHKVNDEVEFEIEGGRKRYRVDAVEAYVPDPATPAADDSSVGAASEAEPQGGEPAAATRTEPGA